MKQRHIIGALLSAALPGILAAAPQLRLSQNTLAPVPIAVGAAGPATLVEAYNIGDGSLNLRATSSVPWLVPTVGSPGNCLFKEGSCTPIRIALQTTALTRGTYTGTITVADPAAVDAPQTVSITVQVGGGVPDRIDLYIAPTAARTETVFSTSTPINIAISTQSGGDWLSVLTEGSNPFRPGTTYRVVAIVPPGTTGGTYNATIVTSGSSLAAENKTVPITLRVTSQPIIAAPARIDFRIAQGSARQTSALALTNTGAGTLDVSGVTATTSSGGSWLAAERTAAGVVNVSANPSGLSPGGYDGSISIANNSAQGTQTVPVHLDVVLASAPVATYRGVVNNTTFEANDVVSQGDIVAIFGEQFTNGDPRSAQSLPLGTDLGSTRVLVNNQPVPIYYLSASQINFQIPYEASVGDAFVRVEREGQRGNDVSVRIVRGAPRLLRLGIGDYGIIVNQDGSFPLPARSGLSSRRARAGETLVIYAIGLGPTVPAASTGSGAPGSPLARSTGNYLVRFGITGPFFEASVTATPLYVGLTPNFVGLYQINITIPENAPKGDTVPVVLISDENGPSNTVTIAIE